MVFLQFSLELFLGFVGTITGIISLIISAVYNRKAIFQAKQALNQADKNLKTQLLYEDKKRVSKNLIQILENDKLRLFELSHETEALFNSFEGNFIPFEVVSTIRTGILELGEFEDENAPYSDNNRMTDGDREYLESIAPKINPTEGMDDIEIFQYNFKNEMDSFRKNSKEVIKTNLNNI